jgi:hypothetical protein
MPEDEDDVEPLIPLLLVLPVVVPAVLPGAVV